MNHQKKNDILLSRYPVDYDTLYLKKSHKLSNSAHADPIFQKLLQQKKQCLPEILSPFLKKAVSNLFTNSSTQEKRQPKKYDLAQISPLTHNMKEISALKGKRESFKLFFQSTTKESHKNEKIFSSHRIMKSLSEVKRLSNNKPDHLQSPKKLEKSKGKKLSGLSKQKILTQSYDGSRLSTHQYYEILEQLNQEQSRSIIQPEQSLETEYNSKNPKKSSNFVLKHKLTKELYGQQRQQIKMVRSIVRSDRGGNLNKMIQVRKYKKFVPQTMSIVD